MFTDNRSILKKIIFPITCIIVCIVLLVRCSNRLDDTIIYSSDFFDYYDLTEEEFREGCYYLGKGSYSNQWDSNSMEFVKIENDCTFSELLNYPDDHTGKDFRVLKAPIREKVVSDGFPIYYSYDDYDDVMSLSPELYSFIGMVGDTEDYNKMLIVDCRDNTNAPRVNVGDEIDAYMVFVGIDSETVDCDVPLFYLYSLDLR